MLIGVPKEIKPQENRVGLTPESVKELIDDGNEVLTRPEYSRICDEFEEFKKRDMLSLLKYMIYLVDFMKENSIVWGVGRGSSVASYILYLIGVHRINSIQFDLDWREFLR